jgi:mRNA-degrading endonuclease RelE of RelBE toxin-antitoxin system
MTVAVVISKAAQKEVSKLPAFVQARVADAIVELANYPAVMGVKAMKGQHKGKLRITIGRDYRIMFTVAANVLTIVKVGDRKEIYD